MSRTWNRPSCPSRSDCRPCFSSEVSAGPSVPGACRSSTVTSWYGEAPRGCAFTVCSPSSPDTIRCSGSVGSTCRFARSARAFPKDCVATPPESARSSPAQASVPPAGAKAVRRNGGGRGGRRNDQEGDDRIFHTDSPSGAGRRSDDDVSTRSAEDVARRRFEQCAASGNCSGGSRNLTSLVRKKLISRVRGAGLRGQLALERGEPSQPCGGGIKGPPPGAS